MKNQKKIAKDFKKTGFNYDYVSFKYGVPRGSVFTAYEREKANEKLKKLGKKFK